jgi:hypothetical protein
MVMMRDGPMRVEPFEYIWTPPEPSVMMPAVAGGT